jgi:hypothetical protein
MNTSGIAQKSSLNAPVHARQSTNVCKNVLDGIRQLEGVDVTKSELDVRIDDELCKTQDFTAQVERVSETRLLALLRRQSLDRL